MSRFSNLALSITCAVGALVSAAALYDSGDSAPSPTPLLETPGSDDTAPIDSVPVARGYERVLRGRRAIRVALDLVRSAEVDAARDRRPGTERDARLVGRLVGASGQPVVGFVRFVAGPNKGREASTDRYGRFSVADLVPGCSLVEVTRAGTCVARREVRLAASRESRFHLTWAGAASFGGRVCDVDGAGIGHAAVHIDGRVVRTSGDGRFEVDGVPAGVLPVDVVAEGYASVRRRVSLQPYAGGEELCVTMHAESRLELCPPAGARGPMRVWLLPATAVAVTGTPWDHFGELLLDGEPLRLRGLPAGPVRVYAHGVECTLDGGARRLVLSQHVDVRVEIPLAIRVPALRGRVQRRGSPVAGAAVESWASRPRSTSASWMKLPATSFDEAVLPLLPPAYERVRADAAGNFRLSAVSSDDDWRQLRISVDGAVVADRGLSPHVRDLRVDLSAAEAWGGSLALDLESITEVTSLEVVVQGQSRPAAVLPPGEPLVLDDLVAGLWRVRISSGPFDLLDRAVVWIPSQRQQRMTVTW